MSYKSGLLNRVLLPGLLVGVMFLTLSSAREAAAQAGGTIEAGTTISIRTNDTINVTNSDGRVYSGMVSQNVLNRRGDVAIPRGAYAELVVRNVSANRVVLDLDSITVDRLRYGIVGEDRYNLADDGFGTNSRTGAYVGGGAAIGAIIGAITGGGKGAAIGGGLGAAAGAGTQILTQGRRVVVPAESLLTFRLQQPLRTVADVGFNRDGNHYHPGYGNSTNSGYSPAYQAGLQAGRADAEGYYLRDARTNRFRNGLDLRDYEAGYNRAYDAYLNQRGNGSLQIGLDRRITWQGPANGQIYVQMDNEPWKLFAAGASGTQPAPWMNAGHVYTFVLQDTSGREIARQQADFRGQSPNPGSRR